METTNERRGKFYYSAKHAEHLANMPPQTVYWFDSSNRAIPKVDKPVRNFCKLDSGEIKEYTEWLSEGDEPTYKSDDLVYLGEGVYHHSEPI